MTSDPVPIVVPADNEADGIAEFNRPLCEVRAKLPERSEVIYVNDGSYDDTFAILRLLQECDPTVSIINLSRNFGKEIALTAGLDHRRGDVVIVIDADLQDPPRTHPGQMSVGGSLDMTEAVVEHPTNVGISGSVDTCVR